MEARNKRPYCPKLDTDTIAKVISEGGTRLEAGIAAGSKSKYDTSIITTVSRRLETDADLKRKLNEYQNDALEVNRRLHERLTKRLLDENEIDLLKPAQKAKMVNDLDRTVIELQKQTKEDANKGNQRKLVEIQNALLRIATANAPRLQVAKEG